MEMDEDRYGEPTGRGTTPSPAAVDRLRAALHAQVTAYTAELDIDLDDVDRSTSTDRVELAAAVVEQQLERLAAFREDVEHVLAEAIVEREAESVVAAASDSLVAPSGPAPPVTRPPTAPDRAPGRLGVAVLASLLALLTVTGVQQVPELEATSTSRPADEQVADRQRQAETGDAEELAELGGMTLRRQQAAGVEGSGRDGDAVRQRLGALLADRQDALLELSIGTTSGAALLERIRELTRDLPSASLSGLAHDTLRQDRARSTDDQQARPEQSRSQSQSRAQPPPPSSAPPPQRAEGGDAEPQPAPARQPSGQGDQPPPEESSPPAEQAEPGADQEPPPADHDDESLPPLVDDGAALGEGAAGLGQR